MTTTFDIAIVGAGIAGASAAAQLATTHKVVLIEMEERPGYHSTGRSAAAYEPNYGPPVIRALTRAGRPHFEALGAFTPRESIFLVPAGQEDAAAALLASQKGMKEIPPAEACRKFPLLRPDYARSAILDPVTADIDVDLLHQSYLRQMKQHGGTLLCAAPVTGLRRERGRWHITAGEHRLVAGTVVDAAGAWGDQVAALAGARPAGLQPKRRSVAVVAPPAGLDAMAWPLIGDVAETWYCKPQSGKLLVSPADATPVDPHDAYADDLTLAEGIDRFQQATSLEITRLEHSWGGLRSFVADGCPVVGYDRQVEGFFWLIGQGGYGIQSSPGLSRLAAARIRHEPVPQDLLDEGLRLADLDPARLG
jgi:D-arginine dehydrogenase